MNDTERKSVQNMGLRTSKNLIEARQIMLTMRGTGVSEKEVQTKVRQFWKNEERDKNAGLHIKTTVMGNYSE